MITHKILNTIDHKIRPAAMRRRLMTLAYKNNPNKEHKTNHDNDLEDNTQIFQVYPPRNDVTIADVEDIIYMTNNMNDMNKRELYSMYGIDYDRVDKYYTTVVYLEKMYSISVGVDLLHHLLLSVWRLLKAFLLMLFDRL